MIQIEIDSVEICLYDLVCMCVCVLYVCVFENTLLQLNAKIDRTKRMSHDQYMSHDLLKEEEQV